MVPGVFERVADLQRASDIKSTIDARRALLVVQIDPQFERQLFVRSARRSAADRRWPQFQHGRHGDGLLRRHRRAIQFQLGPRSRCRGGARAARRSCLVQPQSRDTLVHDSRHDRHVDTAPDHDAHGDVGRARARGRHLRSTAGDARFVLSKSWPAKRCLPWWSARFRPPACCSSRSCGFEFPLSARTSRSLRDCCCSCWRRWVSDCCSRRLPRPCSRPCFIRCC